jgi:hypothetical protein
VLELASGLMKKEMLGDRYVVSDEIKSKVARFIADTVIVMLKE